MLRAQTKSILNVLVLILISLGAGQTKILQITSKNLPNVLKSQSIVIFYHHPDCQYSSSYKHHYLNVHAHNELQPEHVGIVDCSQQQHLCKKHNISEYPALRKINQDASMEVLNTDLQMGKTDPAYRNKDEYLTAKFADLLKKEPNFVVALFQQEGMPVLDAQKPKSSPYFERIYYLSEGRLARTLAGFVNNKPGCWIYHLTDEQNGQISKHYCGDTYQSPASLNQSISAFLSKLSAHEPAQLSPEQLLLVDSSNYENQTILGYKQLVYWLKHHDMQLQISTHSRISMCSYIYTWTSKCAHCSYETDMSIISRIVEKGYKSRADAEVYTKHKIHSYDVGRNKMVFSQEELRKIAGLSTANNIKNDQFHLVPNLVTVCFATSNNRNLQETVSLHLYKLDKIIATENVEKFFNQVIDSQYQLAKQSVVPKKQETKEQL